MVLMHAIDPRATVHAIAVGDTPYYDSENNQNII